MCANTSSLHSLIVEHCGGSTLLCLSVLHNCKVTTSSTSSSSEDLDVASDADSDDEDLEEQGALNVGIQVHFATAKEEISYSTSYTYSSRLLCNIAVYY